MERIKLTKEEKVVLRIVSDLSGICPSTYPLHIFNLCVRSLMTKGLVKAKFLTNGNVVSAKLTDTGKCYICENPRLHNPFDLKLATLIISIIGTIIAFVVLLVLR